MKSFKIYCNNTIDMCTKSHRKEPDAIMFNLEKMVLFRGKAVRKKYKTRGSKI